MPNVIKLKNSGTANSAPSSLEVGELAINYADGDIYYKNASNAIVKLNTADVSVINDISDVIITAPAEEFQTLQYDGSAWTNKFAPVVSYVRNAEANTITTGTCVYLFGSTGDHATVKRADNNSDTTSSKTVGVVGANIASSQNGPIITRGYIDGIDLSVGYTAGDVLWLGENGAFTKTKPTAPDHLVFIGVVVRATNNGIIYVATQNGYELDELHDVSIVDKTSGDFLKYNGTLWVNDQINLGTDTVGNYMSNVTAGNLISITHTPGEGSSAAIAVTSGTSGQIIVANSAGVPTWVSETGDISISDTGVTAIASNVIVNADINSAAAIAYSKLSLSNSVLNADINTAAAIAHSKLANATAGQVLLGTTTTGVITATAISGDITINGAGVATIAANSVALGTDTTGNYMTDVSGGTGITITHTPGEGSTATIAVTTNTYQPLDADLTAIGALSGTSGVLKKTAANTWALDTANYITDTSTLLLDLQVMQAMETF
jgi:hypothetical protein